MKHPKTLYLLFITLIISTNYAQEIKIIGEPRQGSLLIGSAYNVDSVFFDDEKIQVDNNGIFLFGFDRDDEGSSELIIYSANHRIDTLNFEVIKQDFEIERINNKKQQFSSPPKKELERIKKEREILSTARKQIGNVDTSLYLSGFQRPVRGGRVSGLFGSQRILNGEPRSPHNGMDIADKRGTPVYAMADGIVRLVGDNFYYSGNFVLLDHGQSLSSIYLHLSKTDVVNNQRVTKGQKIGEIGTTGRSTGPHLHWGVGWKNRRIDPQSILDLNF